MKVLEIDDIILPLSSEDLKTYVIPVLGNKKNLKFFYKFYFYFFVK